MLLTACIYPFKFKIRLSFSDGYSQFFLFVPQIHAAFMLLIHLHFSVINFYGERQQLKLFFHLSGARSQVHRFHFNTSSKNSLSVSYHWVYVYIQWYIYTHNIYIWLCIHIHTLEVLTLSFRWLKLIFLAHNSATFKHIYSVLLNVFIGKLTKYRTEFSKAITWTCDWPSAFS